MIYIYIRKYSKNILFSVVLLFTICFSIFASMIRQGIAMIIVLFAYQLFKKNKKIPGIILVFFASLFHATAIVALLFAIDFKKISIKKIFLAILVALFLTVLNEKYQIFVLALNRFGLYEYSNYFYSPYASSGWLAVSYELLRSLVFLLVVYFTYRDSTTKESFKIIMNFVYLTLFCVLGFSMNLFTRVSEYFLLISIVEIPNALSRHRLKKLKFNFIFHLCCDASLLFSCFIN
jgi:hypothetical protein